VLFDYFDLAIVLPEKNVAYARRSDAQTEGSHETAPG